MSKFEAVAVLQAAVFTSPLSVEQIAAHLDMKPSTLYAKLNPYPNPESRHILGLEEALRIAALVGDTTLAEHIHATFDLSTTPNAQDMDEECLESFQALSALVCGIKSGEDYTKLISLFTDAHKELEDIIKRARAEQATKGKRSAS